MLNKDGLEGGRLLVDSRIWSERVFCASTKLVRMKIGKVKSEGHAKIITELFDVIN